MEAAILAWMMTAGLLLGLVLGHSLQTALWHYGAAIGAIVAAIVIYVRRR